MIALLAVESSSRTLIRNHILFIDTLTMLDTTMIISNWEAMFNDNS